MIDGQWIDKFTRAVFIEFLLYNPNTNIYCVMMSVFEFTEDGGGLSPRLRFLSMDFDKTSNVRFHAPFIVETVLLFRCSSSVQIINTHVCA